MIIRHRRQKGSKEERRDSTTEDSPTRNSGDGGKQPGELDSNTTVLTTANLPELPDRLAHTPDHAAEASADEVAA